MTDSIAIAHKDYEVRGGGEVLAEDLARGLDAPLYVGRRDAENEPEDSVDIRAMFGDSTLIKKAVDRGGLTRSIAYMLAWQQEASELTEYDTIVTSGGEPLWYMPTDQQTMVAYTHSTPRLLYDLWHDRDMTGPIGRFAALIGIAQRTIYHDNVHRPDLWVANSDIVARRLQQYWDIPEDKIRVVYPAVDTQSFSPDAAASEDYYFALSRLYRAKRFDEIIEAFNGRDETLLIAGKGPERDRLEELAGENVELLGYVSEQRKRELLAGARAFVFAARNEDFGIAPVEALASGTPVIGPSEGFTQHQIQHQQNGILFDRGRLSAAIDEFQRVGVSWDADQMAEFARANFSKERFEREMRDAVDDAQRRTRVDPDLTMPTREREREVILSE